MSRIVNLSLQKDTVEISKVTTLISLSSLFWALRTWDVALSIGKCFIHRRFKESSYDQKFEECATTQLSKGCLLFGTRIFLLYVSISRFFASNKNYSDFSWSRKAQSIAGLYLSQTKFALESICKFFRFSYRYKKINYTYSNTRQDFSQSQHTVKINNRHTSSPIGNYR